MKLTAAAAAQLNALARAQERNRILSPGFVRGFSPGFNHPWKVRAARDKNDTWRVTVRPGTVNDELALYPYLKTGDPRDWQMPTDYVKPSDLKIFGPDFPIVDRSPFEKEDPPFLLLRSPSADGADLGSFTKAPSRPPYFRGFGNRPVSGLGRVGGADNTAGPDISNWPLYLAYVTVSATPFRATFDFTPYNRQLTTKLQRYRLFAGRRPVASDNVGAGEFCELARLYLLRNPDSPLISDTVYVQQIRFWSLQSAVVQPSYELGNISNTLGEIASLAGLGSLGQAFADSILDSAQANLAAAASVEFWTA